MKKNLRVSLACLSCSLVLGASAALMCVPVASSSLAYDNVDVTDKTNVLHEFVNYDHWSSLAAESWWTCYQDASSMVEGESIYDCIPTRVTSGMSARTASTGDSYLIYPLSMVYDVSTSKGVTIKKVVFGVEWGTSNPTSSYVLQNYAVPFWFLASYRAGEVRMFSDVPYLKCHIQSIFQRLIQPSVGYNPSYGSYVVCSYIETDTQFINWLKVSLVPFNWDYYALNISRLLGAYSVSASDNAGYDMGYQDGLRQGNDAGYKDGYKAGYVAGQNSVTNDMRSFTTLFGAIVDVPIHVLNGLAPMAIWGTPLIYIALSFIFLGVVLWVVRLFI